MEARALNLLEALTRGVEEAASGVRDRVPQSLIATRHDLDIESATRGVYSLPGNVCLTCSGGSLIGCKVACQFESHPLHHAVRFSEFSLQNSGIRLV
jgi:hypothetical protein